MGCIKKCSQVLLGRPRAAGGLRMKTSPCCLRNSGGGDLIAKCGWILPCNCHTRVIHPGIGEPDTLCGNPACSQSPRAMAALLAFAPGGTTLSCSHPITMKRLPASFVIFLPWSQSLPNQENARPVERNEGLGCLTMTYPMLTN